MKASPKYAMDMTDNEWKAARKAAIRGTVHVPSKPVSEMTPDEFAAAHPGAQMRVPKDAMSMTAAEYRTARTKLSKRG